MPGFLEPQTNVIELAWCSEKRSPRFHKSPYPNRGSSGTGKFRTSQPQRKWVSMTPQTQVCFGVEYWPLSASNIDPSLAPKFRSGYQR
jgi:hypothetical protein